MRDKDGVDLEPAWKIDDSTEIEIIPDVERGIRPFRREIEWIQSLPDAKGPQTGIIVASSL